MKWGKEQTYNNLIYYVNMRMQWGMDPADLKNTWKRFININDYKVVLFGSGSITVFVSTPLMGLLSLLTEEIMEKSLMIRILLLMGWLGQTELPLLLYQSIKK